MVYLEQSAMRAYDRRAYQDVIACIEPALRLLGDSPDTPERDRTELRLRRLYAVMQSQIGGFAAAGLLENLTRTQTLCERLADSAALFDAMSALCLFHANGGDLVQGDRIGERLCLLSETLAPSAALQAKFMRGSIAVWTGRLSDAESFLASAMASPVALEDAERPYAVNPVVAVRSAEALRRWAEGDAAGARAVQREGLALAERHGRPFTLAHVTTMSAIILLLEEDWGEPGSSPPALSTSRTSMGLRAGWGRRRWCAAGCSSRSGTARGRSRQMQAGLAALRQAGLRLGDALIPFLAGACLRTDRPDEGLAAVDEGLAYCRETTAVILRARAVAAARGADLAARAGHGLDAAGGNAGRG